MSLRRTGLQRKTELRRTPMPRTAAPRARVVRAQVAKGRRDTGPTRVQRDAVYDRAMGCCEICGRRLLVLGAPAGAPFSVHHRQPRGMGGSSRPEINSPANLLLLCGHATTPDGCHAYVEANRARAYENGWLVRATADPATVEVLLEGGDWYLLNDAGDQTLTREGERE